MTEIAWAPGAAFLRRLSACANQMLRMGVDEPGAELGRFTPKKGLNIRRSEQSYRDFLAVTVILGLLGAVQDVQERSRKAIGSQEKENICLLVRSRARTAYSTGGCRLVELELDQKLVLFESIAISLSQLHAHRCILVLTHLWLQLGWSAPQKQSC
ncbi:hypothetical protein B0H12DRAFT_287616 [Mycena haematopus]|nr:hypothetical protein B0H12DRAFT_287616 [Mycena haematopus]